MQGQRTPRDTLRVQTDPPGTTRAPMQEDAWRLAARLPGAPQYLSAFAARLYTKGSGREKALAFLAEVIQQTEDPELRRRLIQRHHDIRTGVVKGPVEHPATRAGRKPAGSPWSVDR